MNRLINRASVNHPRVWLIAAYRSGEQTQLLALAQALGWPFDIKRLSYRKAVFLPHLLGCGNLRGLRRNQSSPLQPPWPDLVISAGVRNEPVCRWIRQQSNGHTRIVHVGRPWAHPRRFDLVITTPQYHVPEHPHVLRNNLTLHSVNKVFLRAQQQSWQKTFQHLKRPYIAVLIGGHSGPYTFGPKAAARLARLTSAMAAQCGGSLLVSTSSRTPLKAAQVLEQNVTAPHYFYRWRPGDDQNPYYAFLALADTLIVTADSIAMLSEACATGKRLYLFDNGSGVYAMHQPTQSKDEDNDFRLTAMLYRSLMRWGPQCLSRDISQVHQRLLDEGRAVWLGDDHDTDSCTVVPQQLVSDLEQAVQRIKPWFTG